MGFFVVFCQCKMLCRCSFTMRGMSTEECSICWSFLTSWLVEILLCDHNVGLGFCAVYV